MLNNYPVTFNFELVYQGEKIGFQEISGIPAKLNVEEVTGGGENLFKHKLPTSPVFQNLVCKRGITTRNSKFDSWCLSTINDELTHKIETSDISVNLLDANGQVARSWTFYKA